MEQEGTRESTLDWLVLNPLRLGTDRGSSVLRLTDSRSVICAKAYTGTRMLIAFSYSCIPD